MQDNVRDNHDVYVVDLKHIAKALWDRIWIIILAGCLAAAVGFTLSAFVMTPKYASSTKLYVNNSNILGDMDVTIGGADISASRSLVQTYIVILNDRVTLEKVIATAEVDYTYEDLEDMIKAAAVNETEVMQVTVTSDDPYEAARIANAIAEVLPTRIQDIVKGTTAVVVSPGIADTDKVSPSVTIYTAIGLMAGVFVAALVIGVSAYLDNTIHDESYMLNTYGYSLLAVVPDLNDEKSSSYGYRKYGGYGQNGRDVGKEGK